MVIKQKADITLQAYGSDLLSNPNVSFAAVVEKDGAYVIQVGTYKPQMQQDIHVMAAHAIGGPWHEIPSRLPVPVDAAGATDAIMVQAEAATKEYVDVEVVHSPPIIAQHAIRHRPACGGDSIGNARSVSAGTLGAVVEFGSRPGKFILTNWHVLDAGQGQPGDPVLQPGKLDGGVDPVDRIAQLHWSTITDRVDVAIAMLNPNDAATMVTGQIRCANQIAGKQPQPAIGSQAGKCGRTTGFMQGVVHSLNATIKVVYPSDNGAVVRTFVDQIMLTHISDAGDSGSIVTDANANAIGLLFAGDGVSRSFANRIDEVESALSQVGLSPLQF